MVNKIKPAKSWRLSERCSFRKIRTDLVWGWPEKGRSMWNRSNSVGTDQNFWLRSSEILAYVEHLDTWCDWTATNCLPHLYRRSRLEMWGEIWRPGSKSEWQNGDRLRPRSGGSTHPILRQPSHSDSCQISIDPWDDQSTTTPRSPTAVGVREVAPGAIQRNTLWGEAVIAYTPQWSKLHQRKSH